MLTTSYQKGLKGEELAQKYLENLGFVILHKRFKTAWGELDIVAAKEKSVVFCEVKLRKYLDLRCITPLQQKRIENCANFWLTKNCEYLDYNLSFSVLFMISSEKRLIYIPNAWTCG